MEKERSEWMIIAQSSILKSILPLIDDIDRAIKMAFNIKEMVSEEQKANAQSWLEGLLLIQKNMVKQLNDLGIHEIDTSKTFNPELHEALIQVEQSGKPCGSIIDVMTKGYTYQGKVIRHAQVSVAQ
jgi:molecular chaperone GrpE